MNLSLLGFSDTRLIDVSYSENFRNLEFRMNTSDNVGELFPIDAPDLNDTSIPIKSKVKDAMDWRC